MPVKSLIDEWIEIAKAMDPVPTHIISVCDTFDYTDYPVYVASDEDVNDVKKRYYNKNMQRINEIIELKNL